MINEISNYLHGFKNKVMESDDILKTCKEKIYMYSKYLEEEGLKKDYEENFFTILGYTYRLEDNKQRLFYTFQEAVYAIDLDKLMKNEDSLKLNTIVYTLVLSSIIKEYKTNIINEDEKKIALETYKKLEDRKARENKKYHMYQN
jgi:hypothetical protein